MEKHQLGDFREEAHHINHLEIKAVPLGLKFLRRASTASHILIQSDNTSNVIYINAMGEIKSMKCNNMATIMWEWCTNQMSGSLPATSQGTKMVS